MTLLKCYSYIGGEACKEQINVEVKTRCWDEMSLNLPHKCDLQLPTDGMLTFGS
jgi:hypothetical protein